MLEQMSRVVPIYDDAFRTTYTKPKCLKGDIEETGLLLQFFCLKCPPASWFKAFRFSVSYSSHWHIWHLKLMEEKCTVTFCSKMMNVTEIFYSSYNLENSCHDYSAFRFCSLSTTLQPSGNFFNTKLTAVPNRRTFSSTPAWTCVHLVL